MRVALIHDVQLPVEAYGGTERVVWWLAKGLHQRGIEVTLVCKSGSSCPYAKVFYADFSKPGFSKPIEEQLDTIDIFHHFVSPVAEPTRPYLVTIGGNGKWEEYFLKNTVFVSQNHALRHGSKSFAYNGIDPDDYFYSEKKSSALLFLAKASWNVKNVKGAISIARRSKRELNIIGGRRWLLNSWRGIHWRGLLGGAEKAKCIADSSALLFPVLWDEPFGLAVVESLMSGTPVLASSRGSLPELISPEVGRICYTEDEFIDAVQSISSVKSTRCREWAMDRFHYLIMTDCYLKKYEKILNGETLNDEPPTRVGKDSHMSLQSVQPPLHV